jgi:hypothetical protein
MSNSYLSGIHYVEVQHGASRELWVMAGPRKEAVANVLNTSGEAAHLKLRNGEACEYGQPASDRVGLALLARADEVIE